jgi:putative restriction endonuclease
MPIRPTHIVEALTQLGGEAHLDQIVAKVVELVPDHSAVNPGASIRARLQENSSGSKQYKGRSDLFENVHGPAARAGIWRLKMDPLSADNLDGVLDEAEVEIVASEGRARLRIHLRRERSRKLIKAFKASLSNFTCEACGTDMEAVYGALGAGYIEAHHRTPVSHLKDGDKTKLADLAALCPNCHRIIHRNDLMSVADLRNHLQRRARPLALVAETAHPWTLDQPDEA